MTFWTIGAYVLVALNTRRPASTGAPGTSSVSPNEPVYTSSLDVAGIKTFGVLLCQIGPEHVVTGRSQSVAAHAAVVRGLVRRLAMAGQGHHNIARRDVAVVDHVFARHARHHRGIDNDGADQIPHVGRFTAGRADVQTFFAQVGQKGLLCLG